MSRETTLKRILDGGVVAVVRSESSESLVKVVEALAEGGVTAAEITFTVPNALDVIREARLRDRRRPGAGCRDRARPRNGPRRTAGRGGVPRLAEFQPRGDPPLPPLRQGGHARRVHPHRDHQRLGNRGRRRQSLSRRRGRPSLPESRFEARFPRSA